MQLSEFSAQLSALVGQTSKFLVRVEGSRLGTGTIYDQSSEGKTRILTSASVAAGRERIPIRHGQTLLDARVVGWDLAADLALIEVDTLLPVPVWQRELPETGALVLVLGMSKGEVEAVFGMAKRVSGPWTSRQGVALTGWIDVDCGLPRGFPGGPLVGAAGGLLGVNVRGITPGGTTIPTQTLDRLVGELAQGSQSRPGYLGVSIQPVTTKVDNTNTTFQPALMVMALEQDGPLARAGAHQGDILIEIGGVRISSSSELLSWLSVSGGKTVEVWLKRSGQDFRVPVTIGIRSRAGCGR